MRISYRTRRLLQRIAVAILILVLVLALIAGGYLLWIGRYIYYTRDGAVLNMDLPPISENGVLAVPPEKEKPVTIYYNEGESNTASKELSQLVGYYIDAEQLKDIPTVKQQLQALPKGTPIMIDVKSIYGNFYYSSSVTDSRNSEIDTKAMDELLAYLDQSGAYIIARFPALRDKEYGLAHDEDGVFHSSRGYLWMDEEGCYWLNPGREGTISHITRTINELKGLGFDEVILTDFCFPETDNIYTGGDQTELITNAAKTLVDTCGTETFAVSFAGDAKFPLPAGRSRLYVESAAASEAITIAQETGFETPEIHLVFLTENHDTRFNNYGVLRPLSSAH